MRTAAKKTTTAKKAPVKKTRKAGRPTKAESEKIKLEKIQQAEIKEIESRPKSNVKEVPYTVKDSINKEKTFIITLDVEGNVFIDPIPQYCDVLNFRAFAASTPEIPPSDTFNFKASMDVVSYKGMEITTMVLDTPKRMNPFTELFGLRKGVGGNIIFTMPGKGFTKKEVDKYYKIIIADLQKEIEIKIED